jgi:hypothetical protein
MSDFSRIAAFPPPESLKRWVAGAWRVEAPDGHEVHTAPDASIDIVLASNEAFDGVFVGGPLMSFTKRALKGRTSLWCVSLRPGFAPLLGVSADALPTDWTPLAELQLSGARHPPDAGLPASSGSSKRALKPRDSTNVSPRRSRASTRAGAA